MACQAQMAHERAAERPPVSAQVRACGPVGAPMDADIEHHKAMAKLRVCLELQGDVLEPQSSPAPDAALVRACMEARGSQVLW
jgi:hypothetical protein